MNRTYILRRMLKSKFFMLGVFGVTLMSLMVIISPLIIVHDPYTSSLTEKFIGPQFLQYGWNGFVFGTDSMGRDVLTRLLIGGRYSLTIAICSAVISALIGITLGMLSGYFGGAFDIAIMGVCDVMSSFPVLLLAIVAVSIFGTSIPVLIITMSLCSWVGFARLSRNNVLTLRNREFVLAAKALGASSPHIIAKEIFSNITTPLLIQFSQSIGTMIKLEASLSFLDMGVPSPLPSWGSMISAGRSFVVIAPWVVVAPACFLAFTILSFSFLGDGLRDVLDPKAF